MSPTNRNSSNPSFSVIRNSPSSVESESRTNFNPSERMLTMNFTRRILLQGLASIAGFLRFGFKPTLIEQKLPNGHVLRPRTRIECLTTPEEDTSIEAAFRASKYAAFGSCFLLEDKDESGCVTRRWTCIVIDRVAVSDRFIRRIQSLRSGKATIFKTWVTHSAPDSRNWKSEVLNAPEKHITDDCDESFLGTRI